MIGKLWALLCRLSLAAGCGVSAGGLGLIAVRFPYAVLAAAGLVLWRHLGRGGVSTAYGTASVSGITDLADRGMIEGRGVILGRTLPERVPKWAALVGLLSPSVSSATACRMFLAAFVGRRWLDGRMIRLPNFVHLATFAPAGGGKGVGVLIPNLKSYRGSCVVTDPKGELAKLTGRFRRRKFGHSVYFLNPFGLRGLESASLNPLDFIDPAAATFLDDCRDLANTLVVRTGKEADPHWNDSCELVLTAVIAFVCGCEPDRKLRTFQTVRSILSGRHSFAKAVETMQQHADTCQGVIRRLGSQLTWFEGKELASVLTTVARTTQFLDSPVIARNTASSSFDPMSLRRGKATVYLILPADKLNSLAALQRLWINTIMRRVTSGPPTEKNPVLWLLDEMAHIGRVPAVEDAVTLMRGMGMRLWFFFQSREQLKLCFGDKAGTVLDNIGTQQYFGLSSYETAEEVSKRIGDTTIATRTGSTSTSDSQPVGGAGPSGGQPGSRSTSHTVNTSEIARRLLKPEEILTLPRDLALVFHDNMPVIPARLVKYFNASEFRFGRTGGQGGLGLTGGLLAASLLGVSIAFLDLSGRVASLPPMAPPSVPRAAALVRPARPVPSKPVMSPAGRRRERAVASARGGL